MNRISIRRTAASALGIVVATGTVAGVSAFASSGSDRPAAAEPVALSATAQDPRVVVPSLAYAGMTAEKADSREYRARKAAERAAAEKAAREKAAREKAAREKAAREKAAREKAAREKAAREERARERREAAASRSSRSSSRYGGSAKAIARAMVADRGWSSSQFGCLDRLWEKESGWNYRAQNPSSGAYGIPQALPGSKMASAGSDWRSNPATQIEWGIGYIADRYGTPCSAWAHSQANNWY